MAFVVMVEHSDSPFVAYHPGGEGRATAQRSAAALLAKFERNGYACTGDDGDEWEAENVFGARITMRIVEWPDAPRSWN